MTSLGPGLDEGTGDSITSRLRTADEFQAVIDEYTAKLVAETVGVITGPATRTFARTGAIDVEPLVAELHAAADRADATAAERDLCRSLSGYAVVSGDRRAVPGWHEMVDHGPPAPPGYMGTYSCVQDFIREIGFLVITRTDGRVHVFQNPERW